MQHDGESFAVGGRWRQVRCSQEYALHQLTAREIWLARVGSNMKYCTNSAAQMRTCGTAWIGHAALTSRPLKSLCTDTRVNWSENVRCPTVIYDSVCICTLYMYNTREIG